MKKNTLVKIIVGILSVVVLAGGAIAATNSKNIDIFFRNIKLMIDGAEYVPTDADGNVVEPFIYNGTTYLPVRAVANAFGKDVKWDGKNATVYIGKEDRMDPDNRLDKVQYNNYIEGADRNDFTIINGTITDVNKVNYTNGILFYVNHAFTNSTIEEDKDGADTIIEYPLNIQYEGLMGKVVVPLKYNILSWGESECRRSMISVWIYGDDELLYKANGITDSMAFLFDLDLRGVNQLTIKVKGEDTSHIALTDLALYE